MAHLDWTIEMWREVLWMDESYIQLNGRAGRVWVTQQSNEEYCEDCLVPKFDNNKRSVMVWGALCGAAGGSTSEVVVWQNKDWGNVTSESYCTVYTCPSSCLTSILG
ncbi:hypothetical protein BDZ91DRAFT_729538 [Kalaharituber pfeilii]|nr:hypothetical protein BDZ91DRAFT_729538 [Kalaharituber pfeilii]